MSVPGGAERRCTGDGARPTELHSGRVLDNRTRPKPDDASKRKETVPSRTTRAKGKYPPGTAWESIQPFGDDHAVANERAEAETQRAPAPARRCHLRSGLRRAGAASQRVVDRRSHLRRGDGVVTSNSAGPPEGRPRRGRAKAVARTHVSRETTPRTSEAHTPEHGPPGDGEEGRTNNERG